MNDFWPENLRDPTAEKPPVVILREAAKDLSEKTEGIVIGEVEKGNVKFTGMKFSYTFHITAPSLDYQFLLLEIEHTITLYPLIIILDEGVIDEISKIYNFRFITKKTDFKRLIPVEEQVIRTDTKDEFINLLKLITKSKRVQKIIQSLLSQAEQ